MKRIILLTLLITTGLISCNNKIIMKNKKEKNKIMSDNYPGPHAIIYKTKKDYYNLVPIIMSDDKTEIISYPGIKDIYYKGKLALPTRLDKGFLLDNRGINKNVAFTKYTYQQYAELSKTPKIEELSKNIIDKNPIIEIYDCGLKNKYTNIVEELNEIINENKLNTLKNLR